MGLKTLTNDCIVSVAVSGGKGSKKYIKVNSLDDLNKLEPNAIKRKFVEANNSTRGAFDRKNHTLATNRLINFKQLHELKLFVEYFMFCVMIKRKNELILKRTN